MHEQGYWTRGLSRRRMLRGASLAAAGISGAALIGCGGEEDEDGAPATATATPTAAPGTATATGTATPAAADTPKQGGKLRVGGTGPFAGVDPHTSVYGGAGVVQQVYNYLFRKEAVRPEVGLIYDLAQSHEVAADQVTWIFKLRTDAVIGPNEMGVPERPLDAEDVVQSFSRVADPANGAVGFPFFFSWVDSYDAVDDHTVRLVTKKPFAWTEENIGDNLYGAIVPREWLESDKLKAFTVGAGPFVLTEITEGERAVMVPNPNFYGPGPYVDQFVMQRFGDQTTYRTAFTSDQIDTYGAQSIDEARELEQSTNDVTRFEEPSTGFRSFWMRTDVAPWDDERVRRAMNRSMNREQYIQIIGRGQGEPIGPMSYVFGRYALSREEVDRLQPYDPDDARKLFEAAGVDEVSFAHPTSSNQNDYVNIMTQQLQQVGVTARPEPLDAGTWVASYFQSKLSASYSLNQSYKTPDFALLWHQTGGVTGTGKYDTGFSDPEVDAALAAAASSMDEEERVQAYLDLQRLILSKDPAFIHVYGEYSNPIVRNRVRGYDHGAGSIDEVSIRNTWIDA